MNYAVAPLLDAIIRVNVFNGGLTTIPTGTNSPVVLEQFDQLLSEIRELTPEADGLKVVEGPAECRLGDISFRCITLRAAIPKSQVPAYSTLSLTAYRNHFFSIWLEWDGTKADPVAAPAYLDALVGAMTR